MRLRTALRLKPGDILSMKNHWMGYNKKILNIIPNDNSKIKLLIQVEDIDNLEIKVFNYRHFKEPS